MSYIRTKDGIYEVVDTYETKYVIGYNLDGFEIVVYKENVIKQADTIEELCDRVVAEEQTDNGLQHFIYKTLEDMRDYAVNVKAVYGAIWTDKGLIYVAKMNESGDLVLI